MKEQIKQKILRAYQVYKSIRKVTKLTGFSYGTVHAVLKERKALLPWSGFDRVERWKGGNRGVVSRWIDYHPGVVLPTSVREISKITGCKNSDVHSWKVARWKKLKLIAKKVVPDKIIKTRRYGKLEIELVDGTILGASELFNLEQKLREKEARNRRREE